MAERAEWRNFFRIRDKRPPWQWGESCVFIKNSPFGNQFKSALTPWLREPLEVFADNRVKEITVQSCVQGAKTTLQIIAAMWAMRFERATMMFNCQSDDDADDFARESFMPAVNAMEEVASLVLKITKNSISFADMYVLIQGANLNNLQSKPIRWLFNDELFRWKKGLLAEARKRTTQYWNRRILNASTAGDANSDLDLAFREGDMRNWSLACPECGAHGNPMDEHLFLADYPSLDEAKKDKAFFDGGEWDYVHVKEMTRYLCLACEARIEHTNKAFRDMNANARYIASNPKPSPGHVSFRWNAYCLSPSVYSWGDDMVEFLKALQQLERGNDVPMREHKTKRRAKSWDAASYFQDKPTVPNSDFLMGEKWADAVAEFLTVDVQKDHYWFTVWAFAADGAMRLRDCGRLETDGAVLEKQEEYGIPYNHVIMDHRWQPAEVEELACAWGWRMMNGTAEKSFAHLTPNGAVRKMYSPPISVDPDSGKSPRKRKYNRALLCKFANEPVSDRLFRLKTSGPTIFGIPRDAPQFFLDQMDSERKVISRNKRTGIEKREWQRIGRRDNHLWDCTKMAIVAAMVRGLLRGEAASPPAPKKDQPDEIKEAA